MAGSRSAPTVSPQAHITRTHNRVPLTRTETASRSAVAQFYRTSATWTEQ